MIITVLNHIIIRIPFSIILSQTDLSLDGIWITLLISFVASFIRVVFINRHVIIKTKVFQGMYKASPSILKCSEGLFIVVRLNFIHKSPYSVSAF